MFLQVEELKLLIADFGGHVEFDTACKTQMSPHQWPVIVWSVGIVDGEPVAYGKDGGVVERITQPSYVCNTLIMRLKLMRAERFKNNKI